MPPSLILPGRRLVAQTPYVTSQKEGVERFMLPMPHVETLLCIFLPLLLFSPPRVFFRFDAFFCRVIGLRPLGFRSLFALLSWVRNQPFFSSTLERKPPGAWVGGVPQYSGSGSRNIHRAGLDLGVLDTMVSGTVYRLTGRGGCFYFFMFFCASV